MSRLLSEEEKRRRQLRRDEKKREKEMNPVLTDRCYEILRILRDTSNHPEIKYNSIFFEKYFGVANITILRDIQKLKEMDLIEERQVNGSYVIKKKVEQFYSNETKKNIALVASIKGLLQQYKNTPLYENIVKLIYFLEPKIAKEDAVLSSGRVTVPPQLEYDINLTDWDKVYEAIQKNYKITFRYAKSYTNTETIRIVCPYQLILDNGTVYLFGHSEYYDVDVLYDLNFMADITVTNELFVLPDDFDFNVRCGGGRLGAFKGNEVQTYRIRFTKYAREWMKHHKWADDQKISEDENSIIVTFSSNQSDRILAMILSWGAQAEPLAPDELVNRWRQEIKAMNEKLTD